MTSTSITANVLKMIGTKDNSTSITRNLSIEYYDLLPYINIGTGNNQYKVDTGGYAIAVKIGTYVIMSFYNIKLNTQLTSGYRNLLKTNLPNVLRPSVPFAGIIYGASHAIFSYVIHEIGDCNLYPTKTASSTTGDTGLFGTISYFTNPSFE